MKNSVMYLIRVWWMINYGQYNHTAKVLCNIKKPYEDKKNPCLLNDFSCSAEGVKGTEYPVTNRLKKKCR